MPRLGISCDIVPFCILVHDEPIEGSVPLLCHLNIVTVGLGLTDRRGSTAGGMIVQCGLCR
jgi:hypothetical protein